MPKNFKHFWLGKDSSQDETATAAIKAVELDTHLGGRPVQYREVQMYESQLFHSYFEKIGGIRYLFGGIKSGFNNVSDIKVATRLYMVKGKKDVRIIQVPVEANSLNKSDSFILEEGDKIYIWNPPGTNVNERVKANFYAKKIRDDEHSGKGKIIMLDDEWDTNEDFWRILKCKPSDIKEKSEIEDSNFEANFKGAKLTLYRVFDNHTSVPKIEKISNGPFKREMLDSQDCFIVDAGRNGLFSWIGKKCTKIEKLAAINGVSEISKTMNYPNYYPVVQMIDGAEITTFKSMFENWA